MLTIFAKTHYHRFLIGLLNISISITVKKLNKRHLPNHIKLFFFFVLIMKQIRKRIPERNKRFNPWSLYDVHKEKEWGGFKVVTCLQILLFLNNKSIIHVCGRGWLRARDWFADVIIVWTLILKLTLIKTWHF